MTKREHIIIANQLTEAAQHSDYLCHAFCHEGYCTFRFNNNAYRMEAGNCLIVRRSELITEVRQSDDFRVTVIYVTPEFIEISTPQSNYGMRGQLALFNNPIMRLNPEQQKVCALDFDYICRRLNLTDHNFHRDAMINAIQCMIIDFYDFHTHLYGNEKITSHYFLLMEQFLAMLERGDFRKNREVGYYADKLCVTPKYLSEVSKQVSGFAANYWINRYTALDISRQLRERLRTDDQGTGIRRKSIVELADLYGFSSPSYFSRFVQKNLGVSPSELRE
ncbi:MAG: AraC family transcriptional regulator [Bacteroidaceae bacterium]|nr:AraC family transcriptional regulator [Bacteroidaceae bacterium]